MQDMCLLIHMKVSITWYREFDSHVVPSSDAGCVSTHTYEGQYNMSTWVQSLVLHGNQTHGLMLYWPSYEWVDRYPASELGTTWESNSRFHVTVSSVSIDVIVSWLSILLTCINYIHSVLCLLCLLMSVSLGCPFSWRVLTTYILSCV
jgi:hypothetical protein